MNSSRVPILLVIASVALIAGTVSAKDSQVELHDSSRTDTLIERRNFPYKEFMQYNQVGFHAALGRVSAADIYQVTTDLCNFLIHQTIDYLVTPIYFAINFIPKLNKYLVGGILWNVFKVKSAFLLKYVIDVFKFLMERLSPVAIDTARDAIQNPSLSGMTHLIEPLLVAPYLVTLGSSLRRRTDEEDFILSTNDAASMFCSYKRMIDAGSGTTVPNQISTYTPFAADVTYTVLSKISRGHPLAFLQKLKLTQPSFHAVIMSIADITQALGDGFNLQQDWQLLVPSCSALAFAAFRAFES